MKEIEISSYWRDKKILQEILSEIGIIEKIKDCKVRCLIFPQEVLYPVLTEISLGMVEAYTPTLCGYPINVNGGDEIQIEFYPKGLKVAPVMIRSKKYIPDKKEFIADVVKN